MHQAPYQGLEMWLNKAKRSRPGPDLVAVKKTILAWVRKNKENYESINLKTVNR